MTCYDLVIMRRHRSGSSRHIRCRVDPVVFRVDEDVKDVPYLVRLQQERMERRAVFGVNSGVRWATLVVSLMLHSASRSQRSQVIAQVMSCAASIVRLNARVSLQRKGCSQPREAKKTEMLYPLQRAESQRVTIRQVASLRWQQGGEGVAASIS